MLFFHPKRFFRKAGTWIGVSCFRMQCRIHRVECKIGKNTHIKHCKVAAKQNGLLVIGDDCTLHGAYFGFYGSGGRIELKDRVFINAYPRSRAAMFVKDKSSIVIESGCLFSNSIDISTTDWHYIYDDSGNLLNPEKDVFIGKHVWIGRKVTICKGVTVQENSIIGSCSVVTKAFSEGNVIIAGNPAEIKKRGVHWGKRY